MTTLERKYGIKPCCLAAMFTLIISIIFNIILFNKCNDMAVIISDLDMAMMKEMSAIDTLHNTNYKLFKKLKYDDSLIYLYNSYDSTFNHNSCNCKEPCVRFRGKPNLLDSK